MTLDVPASSKPLALAEIRVLIERILLRGNNIAQLCITYAGQAVLYQESQEMSQKNGILEAGRDPQDILLGLRERRQVQAWSRSFFSLFWM